MLMKFYEAGDAEEFFKMFHGRPFDTLDPSQVCELVYVTSVSTTAADTFPNTYPLSSMTGPWPIIGSSDIQRQPSLSVLQPYREGSGLRQDAYELPFCPVCLDRLDSRLSGLVTGLCQHTFHSQCLQKWDDSRCPVCRYSCTQTVHSPQNATESVPASNASKCSLCESQTHLWVCLICANVGCGRYEHGHARQHYEETGHLYCLEVETQRVWDYAGDGYVHRLIQTKTGGKLVELPSASDAAALTPERLWNARYPGALDRGSNSTAHSHADERSLTRESENEADYMDLLRQKMEALGIEYSNMIVSQLDSQRIFYESQLKTLRANSVTAEEHQAICKEREALASMQVQLQEEIHSLHNELDAVRSTSSKQTTQLKRALEALTKAKKDLADEKSVSDGLYAHVQQLQSNQNKLQGQVADLQEQLRDVMFFVSARQKIEQGDDTLGMAGGDVVVPDKSDGSKTRSRRKR